MSEFVELKKAAASITDEKKNLRWLRSPGSGDPDKRGKKFKKFKKKNTIQTSTPRLGPSIPYDPKYYLVQGTPIKWGTFFNTERKVTQWYTPQSLLLLAHSSSHSHFSPSQATSREISCGRKGTKTNSDGCPWSSSNSYNYVPETL